MIECPESFDRYAYETKHRSLCSYCRSPGKNIDAVTSTVEPDNWNLFSKCQKFFKSQVEKWVSSDLNAVNLVKIWRFRVKNLRSGAFHIQPDLHYFVTLRISISSKSIVDFIRLTQGLIQYRASLWICTLHNACTYIFHQTECAVSDKTDFLC
jgi:hypothetical protein